MTTKDFAILNRRAMRPARRRKGRLLRQRRHLPLQPRKQRLQPRVAVHASICQRRSHALETRRQRPDRTSALLKSP